MQHASLEGKKVVVLGLGISGISAAQFLLNRNASVMGVDQNPDLPITHDSVANLCRQGMAFSPENASIDISRFDMLVVSPGINPGHPLYRQALENHIEIIGEVELACREIKKPCIGITGTNGKTTVTLLVTHILQQSGVKAQALGNIGLPLTSALDVPELQTADVLVIELSSFQLETLLAPCLDAAVILNITPDHLDRYHSLEHYAAAKLGISRNLKKHGVLYIEDKCLKEFGYLLPPRSEGCKNAGSSARSYGYSPCDEIYTDTQTLYFQGVPVWELPPALQGKRSHHVENIMGAFGLCTFLGISAEEFFHALESFQKPAHRIEFVRTIAGVHYYDDSKGTNIDAVIRAVEGFSDKVILIAGGVDKGFPYTPWIKAFQNQVQAIYAIGQSKEKIAKDLSHHLPVYLCNDLEHAVHEASRAAKAGDNVLLSPGCSSFDMFKDYAHRGQEFQRIVNALKEN